MEKVRLYMWGDPDVRCLEVGMMAPNCFGSMAEVIKISARGADINGAPYVNYSVSLGGGASISESMKSGRLLRTTELVNHFTSAELDAIERAFKYKLLYGKEVTVEHLRETIKGVTECQL